MAVYRTELYKLGFRPGGLGSSALHWLTWLCSNSGTARVRGVGEACCLKTPM
jgi:hypothetical protein